jgi:hypothetical protein
MTAATTEPGVASERFEPRSKANGPAGGDRAKAARRPKRREERIAAYRIARRCGTQADRHLEDRSLIHGWIDEGELAVMFGPPTAGKTFLTLDMALHLAASAEWHGCMAAYDPGPIVYLISEGRTEAFENRLVAWGEAHPEIAAKAFVNFHFIAIASDFVGTDDAVQLALSVEDMPRPPSLVVVDTLASNMGHGDEGLAKDVSQLYRNARQLQQLTGCAVLFIHHTGKDVGRGSRGSSNIRAGSDVQLELQASDGVVTLRSDKQRDRPSGGTFAFRLRPVELGTSNRGKPVTSCVVEPLTETERRQAKTRAAAASVKGKPREVLEVLRDEATRSTYKITSSADYPANRNLVTEDDLRRQFYARAYTEDVPLDTRRKSFSRALDDLKAAGLVGHFGRLFWLVQPDDGQQL